MSTNKIFDCDLEQVKKSLKEGQISVCVIGIGRIGLPSALSFAKSGLKTIGLDINEELIKMINSKNFPLKDEPGYQEIFDDVMAKGLFRATSDAKEAISNSDVVLLSLPTPMDQNNIPYYTALTSVGKQLNEFLPLGSIVIVESTIEPGFVENELKQIIEGDKTRLEANKNFGIGVCPETANPGEILSDFAKLPRLVGALDEKTSNTIMAIYEHVFSVDLVKMSNCKTANAVKLTTNVFRDINIAFINELSLLFEKIGIDTFEVLEAAKRKYNFQIHFPGPGVGGPCLPVNSYQFLNTASKFENNLLKIVKAGREINEGMSDHTIDLLLDALKEKNQSISDSTVLILGVSYKPNVKDIQLTPAEPIIEKLKSLGSKVKIFDPYFINENIFGVKTEKTFSDSLSDVDAILLITSHNEFKDLNPVDITSRMPSGVLIDSRGVIDPHAARKAGLIYRGIGRATSK
ncbi:nucleotide sugar dehydrogenase [Nitrosopumilus sp. b1]|uniref:nucleotide sugar dehydrogenase n=1 Tax=Nitrosopumilus sp. b1 TaxID=2109907 RepID=UPI0015F4867F|nr:nucleotide sugar dehydrogenase [Nitrosopumilus sp. b1]KAF6242274.1 nucleotide sugar dehydrogenase [Nitrosopumilus sp. b1]